VSTDTQSELLETALHDVHAGAGARMVPFAGWHMPVQYEGVIAEHNAVRASAGVFDVSHMGQVWVEGPTAALDLQRLLSNDIDKLSEDGFAQYTLLCNERGGIEDDLIVYRVEPDRFLLIVNAGNRLHDVALLDDGVSDTTKVTDESSDWSMLALQGPKALDALAELGIDVRELPTFRVTFADWNGVPLTVATTGYTGERGCEILVPNESAADLWNLLIADERVTPCGLAARDTLRLEMCYPLHGNDITADTNAIEAGLGWVCGFSTDFTGRDALRDVRDAGPARKLVALKAIGRGIPRAGCMVHAGDNQVGQVTSGTMSPSLGTGVALAYVRSDAATTGTPLQIDVRGKRYDAVVTDKPLYRP
jgi:aminomethyltransferase